MTEKSAYNCQQPTANSQQPTANSQQRNLFLDTAKGLAIILVVIGHELQHRYGTEILLFRLIYSFHMPFFMFISGMVFSLKFHDFPSQNLNVSHEITKSVRGLLIPFLCWTLISGVISHRDSMLQYFWGVVESPDRSLWFLLVLFLCRVFFVLVHSFCKKCFRNPSVLILVVMIAVIFSVSIHFAPKVFLGFGLFRAHFPHFALGVFMYQYRERISGFLSSIPANIMMIILFIIIAPCWYLTSPNPFSLRYGELFFRVLKRISPLPGIFLMMSLTKLIVRKNLTYVINSLAFTGKLTLGIYAYHSYFLGMFLPVIVPLSACIILTLITEKIPIVRSLLLGK